jgi:deoxyguanosine kinase
MIVWLSGPTGAGKTSIARLFDAAGHSIVREYAPENLFRAFACHPVTGCEPLQRFLMQARAKAWTDVREAPNVILDRSIDEDINVFCEMHKGNGLLTEQQFGSLTQLGTTLQKGIPAPDLIVFVSAEYDVLLRRMQSAEAPPVIIQTLRTQILLYAEWLRTRTEEVLRIDTTCLTNRTLSKLISGILKC